MPSVAERHDAYLAEFDRRRATGSDAPAAVVALRDRAIERFAQLGFPTTRQEEWRFTSVAPIAETVFASPDPGSSPSADSIEGLRLDEAGAIELVVVDGRVATDLSRLEPLPPGVEVRGLADLIREDFGRLEPYLAQVAPYEQRAFAALNTAFLDDGAVVLIAPGVTLTRPLHVIFVATAPRAPTVSHPRVLLVAGESSQARVIETYAGQPEAAYFSNAVTEIVAQPNSVVDHIKVLRESQRAFHVAATQVQLARSCTFSSHAITLGGKLVRNDIGAVMGGEGAECTLNGLYLAAGEQHIDTHTTIDHAQPHCVSHELYKGILNDRAHGVFNGKIIVRLDAQKTDAKQTNKVLLLSDTARINTKPELEIFADDVRCTHGATVGQLDPEALFYLQSRGIDRQRARGVLIHAFASDVLTRIEEEALRGRLERWLLARLPTADDPGLVR